jgi:Ni/Co efflux regulator RcnB
VVVLCLVVTVLQPHLTLLLVLVLGLDAADLVVSLIAVAALALPLAMADSDKLIRDLPQSRPVLTRRNLILCLTVAVTVGTWYAGPGLSYLPIAALVIGLPVPLVLSRLLAARHDQLQLGLLRNPPRGNLLTHWLQLGNMLVLCGLLASTLFTGAYDAAAFGFGQGTHRAFLIAFLGGLVVLLLVAAVPLKHVRMASNLLMLSGSLLIVAQLVMIFRPAGDPVPIASPLADEWLVGQGGHAELVNYHHVTSTQRDALDIL